MKTWTVNTPLFAYFHCGWNLQLVKEKAFHFYFHVTWKIMTKYFTRFCLCCRASKWRKKMDEMGLLRQRSIFTLFHPRFIVGKDEWFAQELFLDRKTRHKHSVLFPRALLPFHELAISTLNVPLFLFQITYTRIDSPFPFLQRKKGHSHQAWWSFPRWHSFSSTQFAAFRVVF